MFKNEKKRENRENVIRLTKWKEEYHTIRTDKPEQDTAETFVMLHHVGNTGKRGVDDTFRLLPDFIEHH